MEIEYKREVSVVVATYNPNESKLLNTLKSIINQKSVDFEIFVCDDGSSRKTLNRIKEIIHGLELNAQISLIVHEKNQGTCRNILDGLYAANGKYIKLISPGDFLADDYTLHNWVNYMEKSEAKISFGKIICYSEDKNGFQIMQTQLCPQNEELYSGDCNLNKCIVNYLILRDRPVGAAFLSHREYTIKYLERIVEKVTYAEDFAYDLMLLDGIYIKSYPENVVFYEVGNGISTNDKWAKLLEKDRDGLISVMMETPNDNIVIKPYMFKSRFIDKLKKTFLIKDYLLLQLRKHKKKVYTDTSDVNRLRLHSIVQK